MAGWNRRKPIDGPRTGSRLAPTLSWPHLMAMGVGSIVGTGILTLIGTGVDRAGPAILISFIVAGVICGFAALAYAEMSTMMPAAGSAYAYSYASLGELIAWVVGWSLILEYSLVVSTVAVGWSGYASPLLMAKLHFPAYLTHGPVLGGISCEGKFQQASFGINVPAIAIIAIVTALLVRGTHESARVNTALVLLKMVTLSLFVAFALPHFNAANLHPFAPFGYGSTSGACGVKRGAMGAAAIIFFSFYGFDAISTAAEEAKKPERDLSIGIVGSMLICTVIYILVATAAVGALPYVKFANSAETLALILRELGRPGVAQIVAVAAVIALPTVILGFLYGQSRIFLGMARDGFLPPRLAAISGRGTPTRITILTAIVVSILAGILPIDQIAALANAGTLIAFIAVGASLMVMRRRRPDIPRPFRTPAVWLVGPGAILGCLYLFTSLPAKTIEWCLLWNAIGLVIYVLYGRHRSLLGQEAPKL